MSRSDGLGFTTTTFEALSSGFGSTENRNIVWERKIIADFAGNSGFRGDAKESADVDRTAVRPSTIKIDQIFEVESLRLEVLESGIRIGGVIRALNGTANEKDVGDDGISEKNQIKITGGHFVDLVNDEKLRAFQHGNFPGANTPGFSAGDSKLAFPVSSEINVGDGDAKIASGWMTTEERKDRVGFATTSEASNVGDANFAGGGEVSVIVKIAEIAGLLMGANDAVKTIFEVRGESFGSGEINSVVVKLTERKKITLLVAMVQENLFKIVSGAGAFEDNFGTNSNSTPMARFVVDGNLCGGRNFSK